MTSITLDATSITLDAIGGIILLAVVYVVVMLIQTLLLHKLNRKIMFIFSTIILIYYNYRVEKENNDAKREYYRQRAKDFWYKREAFRNTEARNYSSDTIIRLDSSKGFENSTIKSLLIPLQSLDSDSADFEKLLKVICSKYNT